MMLNQSAKDSIDATQAEVTKVGYSSSRIIGVSRRAESHRDQPENLTVIYGGVVSVPSW